MALRPASKGLLKATDQHSEPAERDEVEAHQPRNPPPSSVPTEGFSVEVDGKIKSEYPTAEAAAKVGADLRCGQQAAPPDRSRHHRSRQIAGLRPIRAVRVHSPVRSATAARKRI